MRKRINPKSKWRPLAIDKLMYLAFTELFPKTISNKEVLAFKYKKKRKKRNKERKSYPT